MSKLIVQYCSILLGIVRIQGIFFFIFQIVSLDSRIPFIWRYLHMLYSFFEGMVCTQYDHGSRYITANRRICIVKQTENSTNPGYRGWHTKCKKERQNDSGHLRKCRFLFFHISSLLPLSPTPSLLGPAPPVGPSRLPTSRFTLN